MYNNLDKPLFSLTVGEFMELQRQNISVDTSRHIDTANTDKKYVYGIDGLARLLNCSKPTAQKLKNSGRVPFSQAGRKLVFDVDAVLEALQPKQKGGRNGK